MNVLIVSLFLLTFSIRISADLAAHTKQGLPVLPGTNSGRSLLSSNTQTVGSNSLMYGGSNSGGTSTLLVAEKMNERSASVTNQEDSEFTRFCKALKTIENERLKQRLRLQVNYYCCLTWVN